MADTARDKLEWAVFWTVARLRRKAMAQYEAAKECGYITVGSRAGRSAHDAFFAWCEYKQVPYIVVTRGSKYATVEIDLIAQEWRMSEEGKDSLFAWVYQRWGEVGWGKRRASIMGGTTSIYMHGVANEYAAEVAAKFLEIGSQANGVGRTY
jgi:hypothetical protein